jgi:ABC-type transport system involved in multi-copper enzyme maturation permease subunit
MKYWAILKDSLREAVDTKIIYVMAGLSILVILFVASISFTPLPAEEMMRGLVSGNFVDLIRPGARQGRVEPQPAEPHASGFTFRKIEALQGPANSPTSEYRMTLLMLFPNARAAARARVAPRQAIQQIKNRFALYEQFELIQVADIRLASSAVKPNDPKRPEEDRQVAFTVTTRPTNATLRIWPHQISLFFGAVPLEANAPLGIQLYFIALSILQIGAWVAILVSIILTAYFIPNMLRKGTVDLLLVKPIHRWALLCYKYLGGLIFIFLNTTLAVGGIWLALGLRSGIWANGFLFTILVVTFFFAILYAVSTLFGVLTRSPIVAILMACGTWFLLFLVGFGYQLFETRRHMEEDHQVAEQERWSDNAFASFVKGAHLVLPRTSDLSRLMDQIVRSDFLTGKLTNAARLDRTSITWGESIAVSLLFIAVMLGLSCWRFSSKDY